MNPEKFKKTFEETFKDGEENTILLENSKRLYNAGIGKYPHVEINNVKIRANLHV